MRKEYTHLMAVLTDYVEAALKRAVVEKLEDGSFGGRISGCAGVIAFGNTHQECQDNLRSTLEDWILLGLKLGHPLPVIAEIDLNKEPQREPVDAL
jgi:predicted RNase H-like HicB family nuclease